MTKKITDKRLKWYGHVKRRDKEHMLRRMLDTPISGKRGRQKTRWKDSCKRDVESVWLMEDVLDRTKWTIPATPDDGKSLRRRRIRSTLTCYSAIRKWSAVAQRKKDGL